MTSFRPFTTFHLVVAAVCLALTIGACRIGSRRRGTPVERWLRWSWAMLIVAEQIVAYWWWSRPGRFDPGWTLPLHLCSIAAWIAPLALLSAWRWPKALLYFWGLGLCMQGLVTPLRQDGLQSPAFWFFWFGHLAIVGSSMYQLVALRFRPRASDFGVALAASLLYVAIVIPLNVRFGWNYGFLGKEMPRTGNVLDYLGPWPVRPALIVAVGLATLTVLWAVWLIPPLRWWREPSPG